MLFDSKNRRSAIRDCWIGIINYSVKYVMLIQAKSLHSAYGIVKNSNGRFRKLSVGTSRNVVNRCALGGSIFCQLDPDNRF